MKEEPVVFEIDQLTVNYDKTLVLWDVSFAVKQGCLVGILGPNGAGKSTLLKAALGMVEPLSGKIEFFGSPFKKVINRVAYVPQKNSVDWTFPITVEEVVLMGRYGRLGLLKWPRRADKEAAMRALDALGILSLKDRQISELSGGQQQRAFLARALLQEADIYLLDEPFAGVDQATETIIVEILKRLQKQGKTIFVVHHDLDTVKKYFDTVVMLNVSLIASGPVETTFTPENLQKTFHQRGELLTAMARLAQDKRAGVKL